jgi:hypothetical protein
MQPYIVQYSPPYSKCGTLQRPIACKSNLVKGYVCTDIKQGEGSNKQHAKGMQPRWCPSGLSRTQKRKLQRLRKREAMEQQTEEKPAKPTRTRQEWRPKQVSATPT